MLWGGGEGGGDKARIMGGGVASAKDNRSPVLIDIQPMFCKFHFADFGVPLGEPVRNI